MPKTLYLGVCLLALGAVEGMATPAVAQEWTQDGHDAQRTGYSPEQPLEPWTLRWTWNGPDSSGGTGGHSYHQPAPYVPWEARTCTGGSHVYVPGNANGLYALRKSDGAVAWRFTGGTCNAAPAYDPATGSVIVGTDGGTLHRLSAQTGASLGTYNAGAKISKAAMIVGGSAYALTETGVLHKVALSTMTGAWTYAAGSAAQTLPAYSASRQAILFCSADLNVHCVNEANGSQKWKVKPTTLSPGTHVQFTGGWPVVADQRGVVFVRLLIGDVNTVLWSGGGPSSRWPTTNAAIRQRLVDNPGLRNLFALSLDNGQEAFVPAVGPSGVEDLIGGSPRLRIHNFPVIRVVGGKEVAYTQWRNGETRANWDARWDSHLGEMVLDASTVPGYAAGDVRFVQFEEHDNWIRITDEACPLTAAGDSIFHAHWDASESARITDRSAGLGGTRGNPIKTTKHPPVVRHVQASSAQFNASTHWTTTGMSLVDGRSKAAPGWWVYWNVLDPPTPNRSAYSEGILPRYTYVSDGLVIVEGNGGELFVLRHSGTPMPSPGGGSGGTAPSAPSSLAATAVSSSGINLSWTDGSNNETGFKIERKTGAGGTYAQIAAVGAGTTAFSDTGLTASTQYFYRVRASNGSGDSGFSNEANATTSAATALHTLTVNNGTGDGSYAAGTVVAIAANPATPGTVFDRWTGATVASATSSSTTLTMPAANSAVTATYAAAGGGSLPAPWASADIGSPAIAGDASSSGGAFMVCGAGADIWGVSDSFHFAFMTLTGDGEIAARIVSMENTDPWAKAGVMIRESLAADSAHGFTALTPANGTAFQRRTATAGASTMMAGPNGAASYWLRLARTGDVFTSSVSPDGVSWTVVGQDTIPMAASVLIGIAVTSHNATLLNCATVDSVGGSGGWAGSTEGSSTSRGGGGGGGGGCGATGLELLPVILLLRTIARTPHRVIGMPVAL